MLSQKSEGFCFGVITVLAVVLFLNCLPVGLNLLPPAQLGKLEGFASSESYKKKQAFQELKPIQSYISRKKKNIILLKDKKRRPIAHIQGSKAIAWSPTEDVLLIQNTDQKGGFQLIDLNTGKVSDRAIDSVFGKSFAVADFSNEGKDIKMFTREGLFEKIAIDTLLDRNTNSNSFAMLED